jgi:hypothetical protein
MFLDRIIPKKYYIKNEVCALEVQLNDAQTVFNYSILRSNGKKIDLINSGAISNFNEIPKQILKSKTPIVLIINGKGIVLKKINVSENEIDLNVLIENHLPAINRDDLAIQLFKQHDNTAFLTLCRKSVINELLNSLKNTKYEIANIYIGTPAIIGLSHFWEELNYIPSGSQVIELRNGLIDSISPLLDHKKEVNILGLTISKNYTLCIAAGLSYLMQNIISKNSDAELEGFHKTHTENNKFRFLSICIISLAFVLSIINVIFFTNYFKVNSKLENELSIYQSKYEQINDLLNKYERNRNLIENSGLLSEGKLSEYADKIGASIPEEIILNQLYFNSPKESDSKDSLLEFNNKRLLVKGICNKSLIVNEWLNVLKMQEFVREVHLQKFLYNSDGILPNFEIEIVMK